MDEARVTLSGRLTRDPELQFLNTGKAVVKVSVAVERKWKDNAGEEVKKVSFFDVVQYGQPAEHVAASLKKGYGIIVTGRLEQRSWETEDGSKRSVIEVLADEIAPSLRFVTADIQGIERGEKSGTASRTPLAVDFDENPF